MSGFGNSFKSARESQGLKLEEIAQETRISARFLRAIEEEKFRDLPGGLFNRGFIRTYAKRLGIDAEQSVSEYKALVKEANADESETLTKVSLENSEGHVLPIAIGTLVVLVVLFYVFASDPGVPTEAAAPRLEESEVSARREPAPIPQPAPETLERINLPARIATPVPPTAQTELTDNATGFDVRIDVHNDTWVSVQSDGEAVVEGVILGAGTTRRYSANEALELTIGNAAGLTLSINGREVPTLGRDGQVRILTITPNNIERLTGS